MQISLRSQMIAGTTAIVGAAAIAMTPIAPAASLPSLSVSKAAVSLAAWANPLAALVGSVNLGVNYLINGNYNYDSAAANWGLESGIADNVNSDYLPAAYWTDGTGYLPAITNVGLIPNFISVPFPVGTQVVNNWIGYANTAWQAAGQAVADLTTVLWAPIGLTAAIATAVLSGQIATIPAIIQGAVTEVVANLTDAVQAVIGGVTTIVQNFVAKATATVQVLAASVPAVLANLTTQIGTLTTTAQTVAGNITTALAAGNVNEAWNAAVAGLLGPGTDGNVSIPADLLNLTLGAGVQLGDVTDSTSYRANFVPSVRNEVQSLGQGLSIALATTAPVAAASVRSAAAKTVKAAPAEAVAATDNAAADSAAAPAKKATAKVGRHAAAAKAAAAK